MVIKTDINGGKNFLDTLKNKVIVIKLMIMLSIRGTVIEVPKIMYSNDLKYIVNGPYNQ